MVVIAPDYQLVVNWFNGIKVPPYPFNDFILNCKEDFMSFEWELCFVYRNFNFKLQGRRWFDGEGVVCGVNFLYVVFGSP